MESRVSKTVIIVGAGPAGVSAAIQLIRSGIDLLLISENLGGLVRNANFIENLITHPQGITGEDLCGVITQSVKSLSIPYLAAKVLSLVKEQDCFKIETVEGRFCARYVIVASGTIPKPLPLPFAVKLKVENRLFYERYHLIEEIDHLPVGRGPTVLIIGGGDAAFDYALSLSSRAQKIDLVHRCENPTALLILIERARANEKIHIHPKTRLKFAHLKANGIETELVTDNRVRREIYDFILVAIGRGPNTDFLGEGLSLDSNCSRLWFAGDIKNKGHRQIAIAAGDGLRAVMEIIECTTEK